MDAGGYVAALRDLDGKMIADGYLARSRGRRGERPRFTDKLLTNFLYCALLLRAFPNARIVHATPHPLAACSPISRTSFNATSPVAYDSRAIRELYAACRPPSAHW